MELFFTNLIGTLAVILVVAGFIGGSNILPKFMSAHREYQYSILAGVIGGLFGVYANMTGVEFNGAIITVRDIGPMLSGYIGGPLGGLIAGLICGLHRLMLGGITANACIIATCCIGLMCSFIFRDANTHLIKPSYAMLIGALMEVFHLSLVLIMVKPFETAMDIVNQIAVPFVLVNALGFTLMILLLNYLQKQRKISRDQARIDSELEIATVIQKSLLPLVTESYPGEIAKGRFEIETYIKAAKKVGGDFYDFFPLDENRFAFLIADVSGKGVPAALFMANAKMTLQNCLRDIPDFTTAIQTANNNLCVNNAAEMFVTAWIGILDINTRKVTFISAGHNPPLLLHKKNAEYIKMKNSFILAGMENMRYHANEIELQKGDILYLYTDGVSEATNSAEELYGEERLLNCITSAKNSSAKELIDSVNVSLDNFVKGYEQADDITMLAIKIL